MKITPRVTGDRPIISIVYKCSSRKVLQFIATEEDGSTEPGDPYLYCFSDIYYNVSVRPVVRPHFLVRYFNACNAIDYHNMMRHSDIALYKYWLTHGG